MEAMVTAVGVALSNSQMILVPEATHQTRRAIGAVGGSNRSSQCAARPGDQAIRRIGVVIEFNDGIRGWLQAAELSPISCHRGDRGSWQADVASSVVDGEVPGDGGIGGWVFIFLDLDGFRAPPPQHSQTALKLVTRASGAHI